MKESEVLSNLLLDGFSEDDRIKIDFRTIFFRLLKFWWLFVISVVLFVSLAVLNLFFATPEHEISGTILIKVGQGAGFTQNIVLSDIEGFESTKQIENELEVIGSYSLMRDAIEELPLHASFFVEDKYGRRKELYGRQSPIQLILHDKNTSEFDLPEDNTLLARLRNDDFSIIASEREIGVFKYGENIENWFGTFSIEKNENVDFDEEFPLIISLDNKDQIASQYSGKLDVAVSNKLASVLILTYTDPVPEKGKDIMNKLIEAYNLQAVKEKNVIAENTIVFIDKQLVTLDKELKDIESRIEGYKRTNNISNLSSEFNSFVQNSSFYETQLSRNRIQLEVLESIETYIDNPGGYEVPSALSIEDGTLSDFINRFYQVQREIQRVSRTVQPNNPVLISLEEEAATIRRDIKANLVNIRQSLSIENRNLSQSLGQIESRVSRIPEIERELLEMTRDQERMQENLAYLRGKKEQAELSLAANTVENARVIDLPSASGSPVKPKKVIILAIGMFFGFAVPIGFIYATSIFSQKIRQRSDLEKAIQIPIIGEVSHHDGEGNLVVKKGERSPIAEQFRLLRTNLIFLGKESKKQVILVSSSGPEEGKSFFSLNLGASFSLSDKKVCILEFDLRKPSLLGKTGVSAEIGLSDFLANPKTKIEDILIQSDISENLTLIGCGKIPDDPAELMSSERIHVLFDYLRANFDFIIVDTAPVGTVSDALNLSEVVDLFLYVVRYNVTTNQQVQFIKDLKIKERFKDTYLILNDAKQVNGYYGYAYGYGYENNRKKKVFPV